MFLVALFCLPRSSALLMWIASTIFFLTSPSYTSRSCGLVAVISGGPAAQAGIKIGDTLVSLDGQRVSTLPFGGVKRIFRQPVGVRIRARVLTGKRVRVVTIVLRDLV